MPSHTAIGGRAAVGPVLLLPILCPPLTPSGCLSVLPKPMLGAGSWGPCAHAVCQDWQALPMPRALAAWCCKFLLHLAPDMALPFSTSPHGWGCLKTHPVSDTKIHEQNGCPSKGCRGTENVRPQTAPHLQNGQRQEAKEQREEERRREDKRQQLSPSQASQPSLPMARGRGPTDLSSS